MQTNFLFFILFFGFSAYALSQQAEKSIQPKKPQSLAIAGKTRPAGLKKRVGAFSPLARRELENIRLILNLPLENRKQALSHYGPKTFRLLKALLVSKRESMPIRWKALTSLARLYPHQSLPLVRGALRSSTWFLQNAGLIAMEIIEPKRAVVWANHFLNARSLVVRTAAVDMIKKHGARQYKARLLEKLNAPDSFYKKKSLWIRAHIVSALSALSDPGEEALFISFLQDSDERLHIQAILALEKLTGRSFRPSSKGSDLLAQVQKHKWLDWWAKSDYDSNIKL